MVRKMNGMLAFSITDTHLNLKQKYVNFMVRTAQLTETKGNIKIMLAISLHNSHNKNNVWILRFTAVMRHVLFPCKAIKFPLRINSSSINLTFQQNTLSFCMRI